MIHHFNGRVEIHWVVKWQLNEAVTSEAVASGGRVSAGRKGRETETASEWESANDVIRKAIAQNSSRPSRNDDGVATEAEAVSTVMIVVMIRKSYRGIRAHSAREHTKLLFTRCPVQLCT